MTIRKTKKQDLSRVMQIYEEGRAFMRETGNPDQWTNGHPAQTLIEADIEAGNSYVCLKDDKIVAVFYFNVEEDPTYKKIDGSWPNDQPYAVIHRIARGVDGKGSGEFCIKWCCQQYPNVRIDTHKDNGPMMTLMERLGFIRCGIIWLANGDERVAFQWRSDIIPSISPSSK